MSASWKKALLMTFSLAGAVTLLTLFAFGLGRDARAITSPLPGRPAPDFALEVLFGPRPTVLYQDTRGNADRFIDEMGGQAYPTLLDPGSRTAIAFGLYGVPESYVIGRDGIVLHKQVGAITDEELTDRVEAGLRRTPE